MAPLSNFRRLPMTRTFTGTCEVHGEVDRSEVEQFDGSMQIRFCKKCQWEALNIAARGSDAYTQAQERLRAERLNADLIASGITPRFADRMFANYRVDGDMAKARALAVCQGYADHFVDHYQAGRNLLLLGNVGTGKTHLATSIAQQVIRQHGATAVITSAAEIIRVFKGAMDRNAGYTDRDVLADLAEIDLLCIDEVGAQAGTAYELSVLHEVIDRRYQLIKPTVVISNMDAKGLGQYIGDRALDRLRENGGLLAGFTWASARGAA
ncbi:ATP-binding protein [Pseudomonas sp. MRSN 12121]|uniref:ATP-binding protein n=1 Tax=Pseudomonas sp. MRSN 12121 TaxID=1611770 RepID=UPI0005BEEE72|nr:ATP-binding protein [Pseudomonas sp. MRSN 12121]AJO76478.1 ATP-binding protein [Pseudomonas sp. MRSN 12121]